MQQLKIRLTRGAELSLVPDAHDTTEVALLMDGSILGGVSRNNTPEDLAAIFQRVANWDYSDFIQEFDKAEDQPLPKYIVETEAKYYDTVGCEELSEAMEVVTDWVIAHGGEKDVKIYDGHTNKVIGVFGPSVAAWFFINPTV